MKRIIAYLLCAVLSLSLFVFPANAAGRSTKSKHLPLDVFREDAWESGEGVERISKRSAGGSPVMTFTSKKDAEKVSFTAEFDPLDLSDYNEIVLEMQARGGGEEYSVTVICKGEKGSFTHQDSLLAAGERLYVPLAGELRKSISSITVTVDTKGAIVICGDSEKGVKNHVEFNDYSVKCESFGSEAVYSLIHNNKAYPDVIDAKLSLGKVTEYTDNASLIFAIRSLDLSLLKEAGSTTMSVTDFVANSLRSVTLSTSSTSPAIESKLGKEIADKYLAVRVATGSSMRGSYNWFYMDTNTDVANGYKNILSLPTGNVSKNRIVAMQQGHLLFVLDGEFDFIGEQPEDGGEAA